MFALLIILARFNARYKCTINYIENSEKINQEVDRAENEVRQQTGKYITGEIEQMIQLFSHSQENTNINVNMNNPIEIINLIANNQITSKQMRDLMAPKLIEIFNNLLNLNAEINQNKLREENNDLNNEIEKLKEENKKLREENNVLKNEIENLKEENKILKEENKKLKDEIENLKEENKKLKDEIENLKEENKILKEENKKINDEIKNIKNENTQLREQINTLTNVVNSLEGKISNIEKNKSDLEEKYICLLHESRTMGYYSLKMTLQHSGWHLCHLIQDLFTFLAHKISIQITPGTTFMQIMMSQINSNIESYVNNIMGLNFFQNYLFSLIRYYNNYNYSLRIGLDLNRDEFMFQSTFQVVNIPLFNLLGYIPFAARPLFI